MRRARPARYHFPYLNRAIVHGVFMRALILLFTVLALPFAAAGNYNDTFHCMIKDLHVLDSKGKLRRGNAANVYKGKTFTVERATGKITAEFHANHSPVILWDPAEKDDPRTPYMVEDVLMGASSTKFFLLQIQEHMERGNKPFIWHRWDSVVVGVCK